MQSPTLMTKILIVVVGVVAGVASGCARTPSQESPLDKKIRQEPSSGDAGDIHSSSEAEAPSATVGQDAHTQEELRSPNGLLQTLREQHSAKDANWRQVAGHLSAMGPAALPAIAAAIDEWTSSEKPALIHVLGGISGDESTRLLLGLASDAGDDSIRGMALAALENRPVRVSIGEPQLAMLTERVRTGNAIAAGLGARVLARCETVAAQKRTEVVLGRFMKELEQPTEIGKVHSTYLSPRAFVLNQYLLAFSYIGSEAVPILRRGRDGAHLRSQDGAWLDIARGMAGDQSVTEKLHDLASSHRDKYCRALSVRAYARAAGDEARPLLQALLLDETTSDYGDDRMGPTYLIRLVAQDELARLGEAHD